MAASGTARAAKLLLSDLPWPFHQITHVWRITSRDLDQNVFKMAVNWASKEICRKFGFAQNIVYLRAHLGFFNPRGMDWYNKKRGKIWRQIPFNLCYNYLQKRSYMMVSQLRHQIARSSEFLTIGGWRWPRKKSFSKFPVPWRLSLLKYSILNFRIVTAWHLDTKLFGWKKESLSLWISAVWGFQVN